MSDHTPIEAVPAPIIPSLGVPKESTTYADQVGKAQDLTGFSWAEADDATWPDLPIPSAISSGMSMPEFDNSWGALPLYLVRAAEQWCVHVNKGVKVGSLVVQAFTPGITMTEEQTSAVAYIGGYVEALRPKWTKERIAGEGLHPAFRNGFADAMSFVLRTAALTHNVLTSRQASVLLRVPKTGDANEIKNRFMKIMSLPSSAMAMVRCIEGLLTAMARKLSRDDVSETLNFNSQNRRAILLSYLPVVTVNVTKRENLPNGKTRHVTEKVRQKVHPTINSRYAGLATEAERKIIAAWNRFAKVDEWPLGDRSSWQTELKRAECSVRYLTSASASMRRVLRARKQMAYDVLPAPQKKDARALAASISKIIEAVKEDELKPLVIEYIRMGRIKFYAEAALWKDLPEEPQTEAQDD